MYPEYINEILGVRIAKGESRWRLSRQDNGDLNGRSVRGSRGLEEERWQVGRNEVRLWAPSGD